MKLSVELTTEEQHLLMDAFFWYRQTKEFQNNDGDITDEEYEDEKAQVVALMEKMGLSTVALFDEPF